MIVILIAGLLMTLLLPAIAGALGQARAAVSLSNMRQHGTVLGAYANDWSDSHPYLARPDDTATVFRGAGFVVAAPYFHQAYLWPIPLADSYYDGQLTNGFVHPGVGGDGPVLTSYWMSSSLFARPSFWNAASREFGTDQLGPTRQSEVVFPSAKATLVEVDPDFGLPVATTSGDVRGSLSVGFALADGSAVRRARADCLVPYQFGEAPAPGMLFPAGVFGMHTIDGVLGRDLR